MMNIQEAQRIVDYLSTITKGNKKWDVHTTRSGQVIIRVWDKDAEEFVYWEELNPEYIKAMIYEARYQEV